MYGTFKLVNFFFLTWLSNSVSSFIGSQSENQLHVPVLDSSSPWDSVLTSTYQDAVKGSVDQQAENKALGRDQATYSLGDRNAGPIEDRQASNKGKVRALDSKRQKVERFEKGGWLQNYLRQAKQKASQKEPVKTEKEISGPKIPQECASSSQAKEKSSSIGLSSKKRKSVNPTKDSSNQSVASKIKPNSKSSKRKKMGVSSKTSEIFLRESLSAEENQSELIGQVSQARTEIVYANEFGSYLQKKEKKWFRPSFTIGIHNADRELREKSIHMYHELMGNDILAKLNLRLDRPKWEKIVHLHRLRKTFESHSIKSIVSYIELMNKFFYEPLYKDAQALKRAQEEAVADVEEFWKKFEKAKHEAGSSSLSKVFDSPKDEGRFRALLIRRGYNTLTDNRVSNFILLWWLREKFPKIYGHFHVPKHNTRWKPWSLAFLQDCLLSMDWSVRLQKEIDSNTKVAHFLKNAKLLTNEVITPFKISFAEE